MAKQQKPERGTKWAAKPCPPPRIENSSHLTFFSHLVPYIVGSLWNVPGNEVCHSFWHFRDPCCLQQTSCSCFRSGWRNNIIYWCLLFPCWCCININLHVSGFLPSNLFLSLLWLAPSPSFWFLLSGFLYLPAYLLFLSLFHTPSCRRRNAAGVSLLLTDEIFFHWFRAMKDNCNLNLPLYEGKRGEGGNFH